MEKQIDNIKKVLIERINSSDYPIKELKSNELKSLYKVLSTLDDEHKKSFGNQINALKDDLKIAIGIRQKQLDKLNNRPYSNIDITALFENNCQEPDFISTDNGTQHPLTIEIEKVIDIFTRMGFSAIESRQIDDDYHMFESLNFPKNHPARDDYDTFKTADGLIAPAHTSTMQNRILRAGINQLETIGHIACISYGRVFRNEDVDATHEHTFHQCEGVFVSKDASISQLLGTLRSFFETYYGQKLNVRTQPAYFPFTEPSLEFLIEKPRSIGGKKGQWLEMIGCGMIHPNVLKMAGIDSNVYRGFAWGGGLERLVMLKYGIEDLRNFESGKLAFLKEFR